MTIIYLRRRLPGGFSDSTRKVPRAASSLPYLVLLRVGFVKPISRLTAGALLPRLSTLTGKTGGFLFYDTFPEVAPAGRYPARCPVEPGLSSDGSCVRPRSSFRLTDSRIPYPGVTVKLKRFLSTAKKNAFTYFFMHERELRSRSSHESEKIPRRIIGYNFNATRRHRVGKVSS